jgi:hypothetical protein
LDPPADVALFTGVAVAGVAPVEVVPLVWLGVVAVLVTGVA